MFNYFRKKSKKQSNNLKLELAKLNKREDKLLKRILTASKHYDAMIDEQDKYNRKNPDNPIYIFYQYLWKRW